MSAERVVEVRSRTVLRVLAIVVGVAAVLEVVWISRHILAWVLIALFLAVALDPFVCWIERRTPLPRAPAIGVAYLVLALAIIAIGWTFVPKLVSEVNGFVNQLPNYVHDLTHGRGRLGFLERKYHVVERVREQVKNGGAKRLLGVSGAAIAITKSVITIIAATVTIVFLTFFMLLEGRNWTDSLFGLLPERSRPRWRRVGHDVYRTVGGYVTGNLLISLIAGASITIVLLIMGVPYAVALGLLVAVLDLIPLTGATVAGIVVAAVSFLHSMPAGIVVVVFVIVYQQVENHLLQPLIYGRTVQLSPLVVLRDVLAQRRERAGTAPEPAADG
jgi:predicted PurR-regulated permease PerM